MKDPVVTVFRPGNENMPNAEVGLLLVKTILRDQVP